MNFKVLVHELKKTILMKNNSILYVLLFLFISSCNSVKNTQKALYAGDYDKAIDLSVKNLKKNKKNKKRQSYIATLTNAFKKVKERDEAKIIFLKKENNVEHLKPIYGLYQQLKNRQEKIKPLLPLKNSATGRNVDFKMRNYDDDLLEAKEKYTEHLYNKAVVMYNSAQQDKYKYRAVYNDLQYLDKINPNYKDVRALIAKAHERGIDYVTVAVNNQTRQVIPRQLEEDLLAMDTYGLDNLWTVYHAQENRQLKYDYRLELNLVQINISPERIHEKEIIKEKLIKDGYKYQVNSQGNYVKDSLGNRIKVDKFIKTRCKVYEFRQFKSSQVVGVVTYIDNYSNRILNKFPIESEFVFEHFFANYNGDRRALDTPLYNLTEAQEIRFPTNEQMVYDTGTDLKEKFKYIITKNRFER